MTTAEKAFVIMILVNTLIAVVYFLWGCMVQSARAEGKSPVKRKPEKAGIKKAGKKKAGAGKKEAKAGKEKSRRSKPGEAGAGNRKSGEEIASGNAEKNADRNAEENAEKSADRKAEESAEKSVNRKAEESVNRKAEMNAGGNAEKNADRKAEESAEKSADRKAEENAEENAEKNVNRNAEKSVGGNAEKSAHRNTEKEGKREASHAGEAREEDREADDEEEALPEWKMLSRTGYLFKALVMLLCPVVGVLFFAATQLMYMLFFRTQADLTDVIFGKEKAVASRKADEENERNRVPIEEALAVADKESLRSLVMDVVKGDVKKSLATISLALNSEDTETSHYAASVLRDALNDFRLESQELYNALHRGDDRAPEYACTMIEYMNEVLRQDVFPEIEQRSYVEMMEEACTWLYRSEEHRYRLHCEYIEWLCALLLGLKEYDKMETWCGRCMEIYPEELTSYTIQLKLYFSIQNREKFFDVMDRLKQSDIVIDRDTLDLIRVFS